MIHKKEFYFLRHGQTDHALGLFLDELDIQLNSFGREQAKQIENVISNLPIKSVCYSPLKRAKETKELVVSNRIVPEYEIAHLSECTLDIWKAMTTLGPRAHLKATGPVLSFMEQARSGINQALDLPGPVLIIAHGGIHWATCCFMDVEHEWAINNCIPVHFSCNPDGSWKARKLI